MQKLGTSIPVAFALTVVINALVAAVVGAICVRLKEIYFSFLTLAFQMLLYSLIIAWTAVTGGDQGLTGGVPRPPFLGVRLDDPHHLYLFCCTTLVVSLFLMWHLVQSPFGYTLRMIRDNPRRASFLGIQVWRIRVLAFIVAGVFGGVGGMLISLFVSSAYPDFAYWTVSGEAVFMIMLGGISVFFGPLVGAALLLMLNDFVTKVTEHYSLVLGVIILVFALGLRKGLLGFVVQAWKKYASGALRSREESRSRRAAADMLKIENLHKSFGGVSAISDVSMHFSAGSLTAVIGPNGAGKTSFFNLISGAFRPDRGRILLDGEDIAGLAGARRSCDAESAALSRSPASFHRSLCARRSSERSTPIADGMRDWAGAFRWRKRRPRRTK